MTLTQIKQRVNDELNAEWQSTQQFYNFAREEMPKLISALEKMEFFILDLKEHGLRFDMNPTHDIGSIESIEEFWHGYIRRIEARLKERAVEALLEVSQQKTKLIKLERHDVSQVWPIDLATGVDSPFEYDQGDVVCVEYDELYDLVQENLRLGRHLLPTKGKEWYE